MRICLAHVFLAILVLARYYTEVECWESYEMDLFDLVEELNQNFYDYFGISEVVEF